VASVMSNDDEDVFGELLASTGFSVTSLCGHRN
jgi:hypothetical protein